jgi:transcriptional regulator with XRE-family HTH domain
MILDNQIIYDNESIKRDLRYKRLIESHLSLEVCSKQIGISKPTLSRIENGNTPDLLTFFKILKWLDKDASNYIKYLS